jgi:predicted transcriptional regulator
MPPLNGMKAMATGFGDSFSLAWSRRLAQCMESVVARPHPRLRRASGRKPLTTAAKAIKELIVQVPRNPSPTLTEAELRLMNVLWERGPSTVAGVVAALPEEVELAYSTVLTTLRILEEKGYLRHAKEGRAYVYHPVVDREQVSRNAVRYVLSRFFDDRRDQLVLSILNDADVSDTELRRLKKLIKEER